MTQEIYEQLYDRKEFHEYIKNNLLAMMKMSCTFHHNIKCTNI